MGYCFMHNPYPHSTPSLHAFAIAHHLPSLTRVLAFINDHHRTTTRCFTYLIVIALSTQLVRFLHCEDSPSFAFGSCICFEEQFLKHCDSLRPIRLSLTV